MRLLWLPILLLAPVIQAAVLAIDYGAEFTKLSLVKPGVPFDVILDRDSKRKIQSVVGWKREDRVFGAEGKMSVSLLHGFITGNKLMSSRQDSQKLISPTSNLC
jgi:hypoxia up-regulated 1